MDRAGPVAVERGEVLDGRVALVPGEAVLGEPAVGLEHEPVARDLGHDGRRGHARAAPVAGDEVPLGAGQGGERDEVRDDELGDDAERARAPAIARRVASRMLTRSIVSWSTTPTPTASARSWITAKSSSRRSGVRSLESARLATRRSGARITAAATTGPASGPLPASSIPATRPTPERQARAS